MRAWRPVSIAAAAAALFTLVAPSAGGARPPAGIEIAIRAEIDRHKLQPNSASPETNEVHALYRPGEYAPLWVGRDGRPGPRARDALALIASAADDGLEAAAYGYDGLVRLTNPLASAAPPRESSAAFDVALSYGMLRYVRHLHLGRVDPRTIGLDLTVPADQHDFPEELRRAMEAGPIREAFAPPLPEYGATRTALARYRVVAADPTLAAPAAPTPLRPGAAYGSAIALCRFLTALGDFPSERSGDCPTDRYEGPLVRAVERFQRRHGLATDGVIGKSTAAALQVRPSWRVRQLELALERLRWLGHFRADRVVLINIPMFRLWAWDGRTDPDAEIASIEMAVIVGRAIRTRTPVFAQAMREVIFRPYWNVPRSILRGEILPQILRNPDYIRRNDMEIVRGEGDDAVALAATGEHIAELASGSLRLRQRPGPKNSLGLIKFVFPNDDNVYMHGTPAVSLFAQSRRDFSHGCIRVADPVGLAAWVLRDQPEWNRERIVAATDAAQSSTVKVRTPIQVIVFYTTAVVSPADGTLLFADDIYGYDAALDRALNGYQARTRPVSTWTKSDAG